MESTRIVLHSTLHTKYQAKPGRQEWVSMVKCIYTDWTILAPSSIFKGKDVFQIEFQLNLLGGGLSW